MHTYTTFKMKKRKKIKKKEGYDHMVNDGYKQNQTTCSSKGIVLLSDKTALSLYIPKGQTIFARNSKS